MGSECERCGVTQEDYGDIDWDNYGGQELCEQCAEEAMEEERSLNLNKESQDGK